MGAASSYVDDMRFAHELEPMWVERTDRQKRDLALTWIARAVGELLPDLCEREAMQVFAVQLRQLIEHMSLLALDAIAVTLHHLSEVASAEGDERRADVGTLLHGVASAARALDVVPVGPLADNVLHTLCLRLRQLARALRRLDVESRRMTLDLVDA